MDAARFDRLARSISAHCSRRSLLSVAAGAALALLARPVVSDALAATFLAPKQPCRSGTQCCSRRCNKKGRCAPGPNGQKFCAVGICLPINECYAGEKPCNGGCIPIPVEECCGGCPTGQTCCQAPRIGVCVDLNTDEGHCGRCNRVCPTPNFPGQCQNGRCRAR